MCVKKRRIAPRGNPAETPDPLSSTRTGTEWYLTGYRSAEDTEKLYHHQLHRCQHYHQQHQTQKDPSLIFSGTPFLVAKLRSHHQTQLSPLLHYTHFSKRLRQPLEGRPDCRSRSVGHVGLHCAGALAIDSTENHAMLPVADFI